MNLTQYTVKFDPQIGKFLQPFQTSNVILDDYFYFSHGNFLDHMSIYTPEQVGLILNLTDVEYAQTVEKYIQGAGEQNTAPKVDQENLKSKLAELEKKIDKSKAYEDATQKIAKYEAELKHIQTDIHSVEDIQEKYNAELEQYNQFAHLKNFNLSKIHEDLVQIQNEIVKHEETSLHVKAAEIKTAVTESGFDKGKAGLAIGWGIGIGCFAFVLYLLQSPNSVIYGGLAIGFVIFLLILWSARGKTQVNDVEEDEDLPQVHDEETLIQLKQKRDQILSFLKVQSPDEFFHAKARFGSVAKTLKYLQEHKAKLLESINYDELKKREIEITRELPLLQQITEDPAVLLKSEEYLNTYREIDSIKLQLNQASTPTPNNKTELITLLQSIRNELIEKLPNFTMLLKNSYTANFQSITTELQELLQETHIPSFNIGMETHQLLTLTSLQKCIIQLLLAKHVYQTKFYFVLEGLSQWSGEDLEQIKRVMNFYTADVVEFCLLDEHSNFL